jgi:hypothetical protein
MRSRRLLRVPLGPMRGGHSPGASSRVVPLLPRCDPDIRRTSPDSRRPPNPSAACRLPGSRGRAAASRRPEASESSALQKSHLPKKRWAEILGQVTWGAGSGVPNADCGRQSAGARSSRNLARSRRPSPGPRFLPRKRSKRLCRPVLCDSVPTIRTAAVTLSARASLNPLTSAVKGIQPRSEQ